jgi:hypothetical protein
VDIQVEQFFPDGWFKTSLVDEAEVRVSRDHESRRDGDGCPGEFSQVGALATNEAKIFPANL